MSNVEGVGEGRGCRRTIFYLSCYLLTGRIFDRVTIRASRCSFRTNEHFDARSFKNSTSKIEDEVLAGSVTRLTARCEHLDRLDFCTTKAWLHGCVATQLTLVKRHSAHGQKAKPLTKSSV